MILFIDIETVPVTRDFEELSEVSQKHWRKKSKYLRLKPEEQKDISVAYRGHAGIYAEWSKVVCIGIGYYSKKHQKIKTKAMAHHNEVELLQEFKTLLSQFRKHTSIQFCGHNIKEFDLPFLCRRFIVNKIALPDELMLSGLKPWENNHIDTMNLWKFGEYKRFTSLELLATTLGIASPKIDIDGSEVATVYYNEANLPKITAYCLRDVETTAKVYYRLTGQGIKAD